MIKNFLAIAFLSLVVLLISYKVLPIYGGITYTDAAYFWNLNGNPFEIGSTYSENYLGEDQSNFIFGFFSKSIFIFVLKFFGFSHEIISYLVSFGFLFLTAIASFFVFKNISKNIYFGAFSGIFIILNNISLEYIAFGGMTFHFLSSISFLLLIYLFWKAYLNRRVERGSLIFIVLFSLLNIHAFYFLMYLMLLTGFFIFGLFSKIIPIKELILKYALSIFGIIAANSYWIVPFLQGPLSGDSQATYNNAGIVLKGFLSVASYVNSINFFQYYNFFALNFQQTIFHYVFYFSIVLLLTGTVFFFKKKRHSGILGFIFILYLVFFHLTLGPISEISGGVWLYLWDHVPLFSFFRSFTRYQALIIPLCLFYFAIFNLDWEYKHKNRVYIILIVLILLLNAKMLTGNLSGSIAATKIPDEYKKIDAIFNHDKTSSTIAAFPTGLYEVYTWSANENRALILQSFFLRDYLFDKPVISERASISLHLMNPIFESIFSGDRLRNIEDSFRKMNIEYVLIQKDMVDNFTGEKVKYEKYDNYFNTNPAFSLIENNNFFNLYKFNSDTSVLIADNLSFIKLNSTKYRLHVSGIKDGERIVFLQNFSSQWKMFLNQRNEKFSCDNKIEHIVFDKNFTECLSDQVVYQKDDLNYLFKDSLSGVQHKVVYGYANEWVINSDDIKKNFSKDQYHENPDGSIDLELTLYFKPQSYFYLGLIISGITLAGCLGYLGYATITNRIRSRSNGKSL